MTTITNESGLIGCTLVQLVECSREETSSVASGLYGWNLKRMSQEGRWRP